MIVCAQCNKKNKDGATVCKYCGYNPSALQANPSWGYQNGGYPQAPYQPNAPQSGQYYYDAEGRAYTVRYDYKVTPVEEEDDEEEGEEEDRMTLYPYNPTLTGQQTTKKETKEKNTIAWVGYFCAMLLDVLAWPLCFIGLGVARKNEDEESEEVCKAGLLFTLLRVLSALCLLLVWWGVKTYLPSFFVGVAEWKLAISKIVFFGWPVAMGSIFAEIFIKESSYHIAGKGFFFFSLVVAVLGIIFFDMTWLPIFS